MKIKTPKDYNLLGTKLTFPAGVYDAVKATNQPDHERHGKVFITHPANDRFSMLLQKEDYSVVDSTADAAVPDIKREANNHRVVIDEAGEATVESRENPTMEWNGSQVPLIDDWDTAPGSFIWAVYNEFGICAFVTGGSRRNAQAPWDAWIDTQECVPASEAAEKALDRHGCLREGYEYQPNVKEGESGIVNVGHHTRIVCLTVKRRLIEFG